MTSTLTAKKLQSLLKSAIQSQSKTSRRSGKSRRARKDKRASRQGGGMPSEGMTLQGSRMKVSQEAVALDCTISNPVYQRVCKPVSHPDFGDGVRIEGRQLLADVTTTAGDNQLFGTSGTATAGTINSINLSPDALNGRLALQARNYSRYAFRRVRLHYIPRVATSDVGQFAIAYSTDSAEAAFATNSFQALTAIAPSMVCPFRKESKMEMTYKGDLSWFTEQDGTSNASIRQSSQGVILGFPDATSIGAVLHGWVWVEYEIDLYGQNADYGFTLTKQLRNHDEVRAVEEALRRFRLANEHKDEDVLSVCSGASVARRR